MTVLHSAWQKVRANTETALVSNATFYLYLLYVIDYFIRIHARIPGVGVIRPTLLMAILIILLLVIQAEKLKDRWQHESAKVIKVLIIYVFITLPLVAWPGSVIKNNLPEFVKAVLFFFFTVCIVDSQKRLKTFLVIFVGCQLFRVLEPLYLNATEGYWGSKTHLGGGEFALRLAGGPYDVINGNELGFVIATVVPFLHYLVFPRGILGKIVYFGLLPLLLYAMVLTMSRGAFLALLVVLFFIFIRSNNKLLLVGVAVMAMIFAWGKMSDVQRERYLSLTGADVRGAETAAGRVAGVGHEFELAMEMPIFGHGIGTTPEAKFHRTGRTQAAHSFPAELIIEIGIIGLVIFAKFILTAWRNLKALTGAIGASAATSAEQLWRRDLIYTLQCVFWMYAFYSLNYWGLSQYYWYLFCGLTVVIGRLLNDDFENAVVKTSEPDNEKHSPRRSVARRRHSHVS
ncbi:MAG: O-antigen ligase family protein [Gammaproteobacteria bacterium]|nr:O-antigen ligase family protein [Gammaproteobacteria bacterium]